MCAADLGEGVASAEVANGETGLGPLRQERTPTAFTLGVAGVAVGHGRHSSGKCPIVAPALGVSFTGRLRSTRLVGGPRPLPGSFLGVRRNAWKIRLTSGFGGRNLTLCCALRSHRPGKLTSGRRRSRSRKGRRGTGFGMVESGSGVKPVTRMRCGGVSRMTSRSQGGLVEGLPENSTQGRFHGGACGHMRAAMDSPTAEMWLSC